VETTTTGETTTTWVETTTEPKATTTTTTTTTEYGLHTAHTDLYYAGDYGFAPSSDFIYQDQPLYQAVDENLPGSFLYQDLEFKNGYSIGRVSRALLNFGRISQSYLRLRLKPYFDFFDLNATKWSICIYFYRTKFESERTNK